MNRARMVFGLIKGIMGLLVDEYRRGTLLASLKILRERKGFALADDLSHSELLEEKARRNKTRAFLYFKDRVFSYQEMNQNVNRLANFLYSLGARPGQFLTIMMKNSPRWLDAFFAAQRLGMCAVPVNIALRGDQLVYIFNHSEADFICTDFDLLPYLEKIKEKITKPVKIIVNLENAPEDFSLSEEYISMEQAYRSEVSQEKPPVSPRAGDPCLLMYTSGTTGLPKGVVTRYGKTGIKVMGVLARAMLRPSDIYYTCLPLFHANALLLTVTNALLADARVALSQKFSASKFWDEVSKYNATVFNAIGAMIPILMKQPQKPSEKTHKARYVLSAACPADMWEGFEKRFNVKILEGYGAVDGGGFITLNFGQAPVGSLGKPIGRSRYRVVDENMNDVPPGIPGELIYYVGEQKESSVEYFKDQRATSEKIKDGWFHTGDMVYKDEKGFLYFVGRKTESIRKKGENISEYEVEHAILQHPDILESAVFAVPSELAEDEVMACVVPVEGKTLDPRELKEFLKDHLAKFAIPRYWRILPELPKTETQRVIKRLLKQEGITPDTIDLQERKG